jgi:hypothetical protein
LDFIEKDWIIGVRFSGLEISLVATAIIQRHTHVLMGDCGLPKSGLAREYFILPCFLNKIKEFFKIGNTAKIETGQESGIPCFYFALVYPPREALAGFHQLVELNEANFEVVLG